MHSSPNPNPNLVGANWISLLYLLFYYYLTSFIFKHTIYGTKVWTVLHTDVRDRGQDKIGIQNYMKSLILLFLVDIWHKF
jgi:hypothetical protein